MRSQLDPSPSSGTGRRRKALLTLLGGSALLAATLTPLSAQAASTPTYFGSPTGSGSGQCSQSEPCSLEHLQQVVRADSKQSDVSVQLADGTYRLSAPLRFDDADGGGSHTVTWSAAPGAHPVISGSSDVAAWSKSDAGPGVWVADSPKGVDTRQLYVNGVIAPRASLRLNNADVTPTAAGITINNPALAYLATLPDQGRIEFESLGDFTNRYSPVQSISATAISMVQPIWNNNTWGYDTVQNSFLAGPSWYLDNSLSFLTQTNQWYIDPTGGKLYYKPADGVDPNQLDIELPRMQSLVNIGGTYDKPVSGLAFSGLQFSGTSWLGPSTDGYADQQNGTFLKGTYDYRPADAFSSCSRGCEAFERARTQWYQEPAAVQVSAASRISFTGNTFTNLGQSALGVGNDANATTTGVGLGASSVQIVGNRFTETSGHGIAVGGVLPDAHHPSDPRMTNQDILIQNNTVNRVAVDYKDNSGILSTYVTNASILHNEVSNVPYDGIDTGFGWGTNDAGGSNDYVDRGYYKWNTLYTTPTTLKNTKVEGNLVHNTKARFADGGSVYNLSANPGGVVDKNYLFNISGVGLYLDEGSRSMVYENNVVSGGSFVFTNAYSNRNNTSDNVIRNNWYNSGGVSAPNAAAHNNTLTNNVKVTGAAWPQGAVDVICASGVAPEYRTSLNANQFGFSQCPTDGAVTSEFSTAGSSAVKSVFRQSGTSFGIAAAGADVWSAGSNRADQFGSIFKAGSVNALSSVSTRVVSVNDANSSAKSGVMVRNDMTKAGASAGYAVVAVTARSGVVFEWDANGDGFLESEAKANVDIYRPIWVKLARAGTAFTASYSYDGANYLPISSPVTLASAAAAQDAGIFSTSHDVSQSAINQFGAFTVTAATAPAAPAAPTVGLGDRAAKITWQPGADGGSPITGYTATASPGGASCTAAAPATSCRIDGLTNGTAYTFTVTAQNAFGTSAASAPSAPVTLGFPAGGADVGVSVSAKAQCINGAPSLAVYVMNKEAVKVDARVTTGLGEVKVSGLAPGASKYLTFAGTGTELAAGTGTVATYKYVNGTGYYTVYQLAYAGVSCTK